MIGIAKPLTGKGKLFWKSSASGERKTRAFQLPVIQPNTVVAAPDLREELEKIHLLS